MQERNKHETPYLALLAKYGMSAEQMAEHLARQTGGSAQEWLRAIRTGDKSAICSRTAVNTEVYYKTNEDAFHRGLGQLMMQ